VRADWSRDRNTVSTVPAAKLACHLYELIGEEDYLDWALRLYTWVERYLRAPNGLYWDHIDLAGRVEQTQWSYNQGSMIGANALLYRVSGRQAHLDQAREIAAAALAHYGGDGLLGQPVAFNAIFFRNLLLLQSVDPRSDFRPALRAYVAALWARQVDATGRYRPAPGQPLALLDQAAVAQLAALAAWDPAEYSLLA
jgi:rhamnogalacturonyl hydrolase YesR